MRTISAVARGASRRQFQLESSPDELSRAAKLIDLAVKIRRQVGPARSLGEACVQAGMIQLQLARQAGDRDPSQRVNAALGLLKEGLEAGKTQRSPQAIQELMNLLNWLEGK